MTKSKIILTDDHAVVREGLKNLIQKDRALTVVAEAQDGQELLDLLPSHKCDLIIMDISMPNKDGVTALKEIRRKYPKAKVLILSMLKDFQHFEEVMRHGASGYMVKDDAPDQLLLAIKTIIRGNKFVSPSVSKVLVDRQLRSVDDGEVPSLEILTKREQQVLTMIAKGMANKNIAVKLKLSIRTVEHHRANLTDKLGLKTPAALVKYAIDKGVI
ncbi:MAG: response regulator transcription factor [Candidatus Omnitrophica bacterium]|nr:response regulator transcription factor [Candidatus Omnitrophota bacterium]